MEKNHIKFLCLNFNSTKINKEFCDQCKACEIDFIAGQEIPNNEGKRSFYTDFYVLNNKLELKEFKSDTVNNIWNDVIRFEGIYPSFRHGYWKEIELTFCGKEILFINVHVSPRYSLVLKIVLLEYLKQIQGRYIVLLGDFNAAEEKDTQTPIKENDKFIKLIKEMGFNELREENEDTVGHYTYYQKKDEKKIGKKLDHIFVSNNLNNEFEFEIKYWDKVNRNNGPLGFTDHSAIVASITKRKG